MLTRIADEPTLVGLYRYWDDKRAGRSMPDRRDIDPIEIDYRILPSIALFDLTDHGDTVRCRLAGTEIVRRLGDDPTGRTLEDIASGSYLDYLRSLFQELRTCAAPVYSESRFRWDVADYLDTRRILLPLAWRGAAPGMAITAQVFSCGAQTRRPVTEVHPPIIEEPIRRHAQGGGRPRS